ncbi:hypothetical protein [Treponema sp.]|uniref:hypothetical protein n=1 Tax=Treponema sp. TaxID=166 RepID=UPI003FD8C136
MDFLIKLKKIDINYVAILAEESENNESKFVRKLCRVLLYDIAMNSKKICDELKAINKENPYGFPSL